MNIFRPLNQISKFVNAGCMLLDISDHLPTFFILDCEHSRQKPMTERPKVRIFSQRNYVKFENELKDVCWDNVLTSDECDQAFDHFHDIITAIFDNCFPLVTKSRKKCKDKNWVTKEILAKIRTKNIVYRKHIKNPGDIELHYSLKRLRNELAKDIKIAKINYYRDLLTSDQASIQSIWKVYGELIGKNKKREHRVDKLIVNETEHTSDIDISNAFNTFFSTVGEHLSSQFDKNDNYKDYLLNNVDNSMFIAPIDRIELLSIIKSLDNKKSAGIDSIPPRILIQFCNYFISPLLHIFNLSFEQGVFPSKFKISKVIPLYKKAEKTNPSNYRPISLLSIFSKVLEKVMHKRLYSFLTNNDILFDLQFGFRQNHSTILALIEIVDNIRKEVDSGKSVVGMYLDLSKAFDTVNHNKLLGKLNHYGVRGLVNKWFASYLSGRTQITFVNNTLSDHHAVPVGVPQGSVLGPLLFLVYVNDIAHVLAENKVRLFADDTNIFISGDNIIDLRYEAEESLLKMERWFSVNELSMNMSKTCFTLFSKRLKSSDIELIVNNRQIPYAVSTKYLGIHLDQDLSFNVHTNYIKNKLNKFTSVFYYMSDFLKMDDVRKIYFAYVFPHIKYGIEVYGISSKKNQRSIQGVQNKLLKILCKCNQFDSPSLLHQSMNIFSFLESCIFSILVFVYKQVNGLLPPVFNQYFILNSALGRRSHRSQALLYVPFFRLEFGRKSMTCIAAKLYNNLPTHIKQSGTLDAFKLSLKRALLQGQLSTDDLLR